MAAVSHRRMDRKETVLKEKSAGGVIIDQGKVLVLHKARGGWVLPKGRVEAGESLEETALREVQEEAGVSCRILHYLGYVRYNYSRPNGELVHKEVCFYSMAPEKGTPTPQREEGFSDSLYMPWRKAVKMLRYDSEKNMVRNAFTEKA